MRTVKTGVSIRRETLEKLDRLMKEYGLKSRSRLISEALELYVAEHSWSVSRGTVAGAIVVIYDHETGDTDRRVVDIQHEYIDIIRASTHVHLSKEDCLEVIIVVGPVERVKGLISGLAGLPGVKALRRSLVVIKEEA